LLHAVNFPFPQRIIFQKHFTKMFTIAPSGVLWKSIPEVSINPLLFMEKQHLESTVKSERSHFKHMLAKNKNYFGNIPGSVLKPAFLLITDTNYELLTCVGYNPDTQLMEATFSIRRSTGYGGNLCQAGTFEYVRFYMDFHDGAGFIDQGSVAVNVHNIPAQTDCSGHSIFPIHYTATLKKKTSKFSICDSPVLPTLRAILSWNINPPVDSPNWIPTWGNVMDCDVQLKPSWILTSPLFDISEYLTLAMHAPHLSTKQLSEITQVDLAKLAPTQKNTTFQELVIKNSQFDVPILRTAFKKVNYMIKYPDSDISMMEKTLLENLKIDYNSIIDTIIQFPKDTSKANVDYEELECVGLDYATETLVATLKIKRRTGFSGDLCDQGSKEFISFWVDWNDDCTWEYINTVELKVHDIDMKGDSLCYSVSLPLNATHHRKLCSTPRIIKVRGVLSWNVPPSATNPNELEYYGNRVDSHVQIKPGIEIPPGKVIPLFNIIGGIDVAHVSDASGLTLPGSFFAFNGLSVPSGAPFGGVIVLNGPSFPGYRYKIKVTNLTDGTFFYASNSFTVVGYLSYAPWVQYSTQSVDGDGYYHFLDPSQNTLNVLARFTPATDDKFRVEMEVDTVAGVFVKNIQIDNTWPKIELQIDNSGDCTHYAKGDTITGHFYVFDKYLYYWAFGSTWGSGTADPSGTVNTLPLPGNPFSIVTPVNAYPCGSISLYAVDKTIIDSQSVGHYIPTSYNICLKEKS
jgi:hypothetical protein